MSARTPRRKQGGLADFAERYVSLPWPMLTSAAFRALSSDAVWLLVQLRLQFKAAQGGYSHLVLPFDDVAFHFSGRRFRQARAELERLGFMHTVEHGGLYRKANVYCLTTAWEARTEGLLADAAAGRIVKRRRLRGPGDEWPEGDPRNLREEWRPTKAGSPGRSANLAKARAAKKAPPLIRQEGKRRRAAPITAPAPARYLTRDEMRALDKRLKAGERPEDLAEEIRAQGVRVPLGLMPRNN